jgi:PBP1b-binding outer membrane lipoprotein LpoB
MEMKYAKRVGAAILMAAFACSTSAQDQQKQSENVPASQTKIPAGSKVYVASMGGFETLFKKAMADKKVPLQLVDQREQAEYEITGTSESKKASTAKKVILGSWHSDEDASIKVANLKSGEVVYAYAVHKQDSAHGQKSTAEACAKHLKDEAVAAK